MIQEITAAGVYRDIGQAFVVLLPVKSVGVMGDCRTYEQVGWHNDLISYEGNLLDTSDFMPDMQIFSISQSICTLYTICSLIRNITLLSSTSNACSLCLPLCVSLTLSPVCFSLNRSLFLSLSLWSSHSLSLSAYFSLTPTYIFIYICVTLQACAIRCVTTSDFMTADWYHMDYVLLGKIANRIINECRGINRVCYDVSSKPPATIEWE